MHIEVINMQALVYKAFTMVSPGEAQNWFVALLNRLTENMARTLWALGAAILIAILIHAAAKKSVFVLMLGAIGTFSLVWSIFNGVKHQNVPLFPNEQNVSNTLNASFANSSNMLAFLIVVVLSVFLIGLPVWRSAKTKKVDGKLVAGNKFAAFFLATIGTVGTWSVLMLMYFSWWPSIMDWWHTVMPSV